MPPTAGCRRLGAGADAHRPRHIGDWGGGLDAGADDYLVKSFSQLELAARLPTLARRDVRGDLPGSRELRLGAGPRVVQGLQEPAS